MKEILKLHGKMLNFSTLVLETNDLDIIDKEFAKKIGDDAGGIPVVLDAKEVVDVKKLFDLCWKYGLQPIGVVEGIMTEVAKENHIAIFPRGRALKKIETKSKQDTTILHHKIMRSGQDIYNPEGDLVLTGGINSGAEVIATGSIYTYGKCQGRLVAGSSGDVKATIACQNLNATLISIGGVWCTREDIADDMIGASVYIKLDKDEGLVFTQMNPGLQ